ncbi:MAG: C_GCAxxG_C_C family protein [Oscillospiraceae bacterium]|nr:C_GCAxxG_C_C family protein [Oscillospiraceae bacterium]
MNRMEKANSVHEKGFNCCQSVLAAFSDLYDVSEETALRIGAGFGGGAGTGELCGAITGAVMALDLIACGDVTGDPVSAKRAAAARSKELQNRFMEQFGALRCQELLRNEKEEPSEAVKALGITKHCGVMIASAVELVEELLKEEAQ